MQPSEVAVRLFDDLDATRLARDLDALAQFPRAKQPGPYHDGEWTGVSFYSKNGRYDNAEANHGRRPFIPTEVLKSTPYIKEVLDRLPCPKHSVRLLALPPKAVIRSHRDPDISLQAGKVRLHVPITTHPDVEFLLGGLKHQWKVGELWYGDFSEPHSVTNHSAIVRFHLVIDVPVTTELLALFPSEYVAARRSRGGIAVHRPYFSVSADDLRRYECAFAAPPKVKYINNDPKPVICALKATARDLQLWKGDQHARTFEPVSADEFSMVGAAAGVRLRIQRAADKTSQLNYEVSGVPVIGATIEEFHLEDRQWTFHPIDMG
jgi:hypothetical protein